MGSTERPLVLMGFAESFAAVEAAWSLLRAGIDVVAYARPKARSAVAHVKGVRMLTISAPESSVTAAVADLNDMVARLRPSAFLPLDDASLWLTTRADFLDTVVVGPDRTGAQLALDKSAQLRAADAAGLRTPAWTAVATPLHADPVSWPVIIKPADAVVVRDDRLTRPNGFICANQAELEEARSRLRDTRVIVQAYVRGVGEGLFGYGGQDGPVAWSAHQRIRMMNPNGSAASACRSREVPADVLDAADRLLRDAAWRGLFMVELLRDADGVAWFMELNGRAWGSMALARRRGLEYPAWAVQASLRQPLSPTIPVDPPPIVARHLGREIAHLAFVARGPQSTAVESWPTVGSTLLSLLRIGPRDRLYNWSRREPIVLVSDTINTLLGLFNSWRRPK